MVTIGCSGQGHRDVVKHKRTVTVVLRAVYGRHGADVVREDDADDEDTTDGTKASGHSTPQL